MDGFMIVRTGESFGMTDFYVVLWSYNFVLLLWAYQIDHN